MAATIRAELLKLRTVRSTAGLLLGATLIAALLAFGASSVAGDGGNPEIGDPLFIRNLLAAPSLALITAIVGGVLVSAGEFHHGTAVPTFLATPRRSAVIVAKAVAGLVLGVVLAAVALATTLSVGSAVAAGEGVSIVTELTAADARSIATTFALGAFYAVAGVALGALVRNQLGAVSIAIVWSLIVETMLVPMVAPDLAGWLPAGLFASLGGADRPDLVAVEAAVALVPLYAAGLIAAASLTVERADLT